MGEISEIVDAILYLESANFITGEILHVDGGQAADHHAIKSIGLTISRELQLRADELIE
jgi:NAD(P)-dependent dehydrogenase (short-subunit alcohol dehydrogenase family)